MHWCAIMNQVLTGYDDLLITCQPFGDLNAIITADTNLNIHALRLSIPNNVDVLGVFQTTHGINRNLQGLRMGSY